MLLCEGIKILLAVTKSRYKYEWYQFIAYILFNLLRGAQRTQREGTKTHEGHFNIIIFRLQRRIMLLRGTRTLLNTSSCSSCLPFCCSCSLIELQQHKKQGNQNILQIIWETEWLLIYLQLIGFVKR